MTIVQYEFCIVAALGSQAWFWNERLFKATVTNLNTFPLNIHTYFTQYFTKNFRLPAEKLFFKYVVFLYVSSVT